MSQILAGDKECILNNNVEPKRLSGKQNETPVIVKKSSI